MDLPSRVCRLGHFFLNIFSLSGGKNDSPKKTLKSPKNLMFFGEKFWENIFSYFQKFSAKFSLTVAKTADLHGFSKLKKKKSQNEKNRSVWPVKQGFLFSLPKITL